MPPFGPSDLTETRCSVAVFRGDSLLLVGSEEDGLEVWKLPGGHLHADEGLIACARRELREESGLTAGTLHCAFVLDVHDKDTGRYMIEIILVPSEPVTGEPRECEAGRTPRFVPMNELPQLVLRPTENDYLYALHDLHRGETEEPPPAGPTVQGVVR
ncbi:NUDIX domain-containing protein [Streptomyces sp. NPDC059398]|uniref:NUDIX domain-containing protein n=1 Tax=Streptomyces sp. NPDC059398 TaxID=3346820 RepID=UPI0036C67D1A